MTANSQLRQQLRQMSRSPSAWLGGLVVISVMLLAATADRIAPFGPQERVAVGTLAPPDKDHWLGTDQDGYDVLSRLIHGSRLSLASGLISMALAVVIGATAGLIAGYSGGWLDTVIMRAVDILLSFPGILIAILVVMATSRTSWFPIMVAVGVMNIPVFCRQIRATVLTVRHLDYVVASRAMGASGFHILWRGILPAAISPIVVLVTLGFGAAILEVAGLSFLGIGGQPDDAEWGSMLAAARQYLTRSFWPALAPGAAISLTVLGFNLLGDALRDALDPQLIGR